MRTGRPRKGVGYREARAHALIAATAVWTVAVIGTFAGTADRSLADRLKGADFLQIYTLAHVAFEGPYPTLRTQERFHQRQVELVPASAPEHYLPVYPPSAALLFRPLTLLSYRWALTAWTLVTLVGYAAVILATWFPLRHLLPDRWFLAAGAAAFAPFCNLLLFGQITLIPLAGMFLMWRALDTNRPLLAGLACGLLTVKPHFGLLLPVVFLASRNWRALTGGILSVLATIIFVVLTMGMQSVTAYSETLQAFPRIEHLLAPDEWRMHSLRTLTHLLPHRFGVGAWMLLAAGVVAATVKAWRIEAPLALRMSLLALGTLLVSPHVFVYDAVLLVLPILWFGGWVEQDRPTVRYEYWQLVYLLCVAFLLPTAFLIGIQASVLLMCWLFWRIYQAALSYEEDRYRTASPALPSSQNGPTALVEKPLMESIPTSNRL